jgi:hypothetical protein
MTKRHPVRNSQFMKAIRDVHSFFQEESFKIRNNQPSITAHSDNGACLCLLEG